MSSDLTLTALTAIADPVFLSDEQLVFVGERLANAADFALFKEMLAAPMA